MKTNTTESKIKTLLGNAYGWDSELSELQYQGNPVSFWITPTEEAAVKAALEHQSSLAIEQTMLN